MKLYGICRVHERCVCGLCADITSPQPQHRSAWCDRCNVPKNHNEAKWGCGCVIHNGEIVKYCESHGAIHRDMVLE